MRGWKEREGEEGYEEGGVPRGVLGLRTGEGWELQRRVGTYHTRPVQTLRRDGNQRTGWQSEREEGGEHGKSAEAAAEKLPPSVPGPSCAHGAALAFLPSCPVRQRQDRLRRTLEKTEALRQPGHGSWRQNRKLRRALGATALLWNNPGRLQAGCLPAASRAAG
jgi:hypothetical protein